MNKDFLKLLSSNSLLKKISILLCVIICFSILPSLITTIWNLGYEFGYNTVKFISSIM